MHNRNEEPNCCFPQWRIIGAVNNKTRIVDKYFAKQKITKTQFLANNGSSKWSDAIMDYLSTMLFVEGSLHNPPFVFYADYLNLTEPVDGEGSIASWYISYAVNMFFLLSFRIAPENIIGGQRIQVVQSSLQVIMDTCTERTDNANHRLK